MKVKMLKTSEGSDEAKGVNLGPKQYFADKEYELGPSLAGAFLSMGVAVECKALGGAPENKAYQPIGSVENFSHKGKKGKKKGA
jgi:hypothetical protein